MDDSDQQAVEAYTAGVRHAAAGRLGEARACYEQAVALKPGYLQALNNLGTLLDEAGEHAAAERQFRAAIAADGARPEPWTSLGTNLRAQGRLAEARTAYERALGARPDFAAARWNLALIELAEGRFRDGWTHYLFRPSIDRAIAPLATPPLRESLAGSVIDIEDEQGLGDALFFLRFVPELRRRGAAVRYRPDPRLAGIVGRMVDLGDAPTGAAVLRVALGDLPYVLAAETCPPPLPVAALPERLDAMRRALARAGPPPYLAVTWRAGQIEPGYLSKEAPFAALGEALRDFDGTLIDLQRAPPPGEHAALERALGRTAADFSAHNDELEDMLALMALIDEYVGVSNTNMHLRAAVGRGARVLVAHPAEYRWMAAGETSPWFPGFRLYRQDASGQWGRAFAALRADVHGDRAVLAHRGGAWDAAERHFRLALTSEPGASRVHYNLANLLRDGGRADEAERHYREAVAADPSFAPAHNNLGNLLKQGKRWEEAAESYRAAIAADPGYAPAHRNLADLDESAGRTAGARAGWARVIALRGDAGARIRDALALPVIASSTGEIEEARGRMAARLADLAAAGLRLDDPLAQVGATPFYLAYHGRDDRPLMEALATLYRGACPSLSFEAPHVVRGPAPSDERKRRIGFVSTFWRDHTVARLNENLVAKLPRDRFEIFVFDRLPRDLERARRTIAEPELDVLYYTDIGMEPLTYFLAFARLAPIQCVSWGHPVTTGIATVDCFVSSRLIEPTGAENHYSERLVQLDHLPSSVSAPGRPGSAERGPVFLCPQTLFKLHPDFDAMVGRILERCPGSELVLLEGHHADWQRALAARWRRTIPGVIDRIRFAPRRSRAEFMALLGATRVVLDTPHFCGGLSSFEALVAGTPVVALPGAYMRSRVTEGLYRRMGVSDLVAQDSDTYVELAVRLARDDAFHAAMRDRIADRAPALIDDPAPIAGHVRLFEADGPGTLPLGGAARV